MSIKYSLKDVNKMLSISDGAIRNYEKKGIINVYRNASNHYREFTLEDVHKMMTVRILKRFGLSLDEIKDILLSNQISTSIDSLEKQYNVVQDQIAEQQQNSSNLKDCINVLKRIDSDIDERSFVKRPSVKFYLSTDINKIDDGEYFDSFAYQVDLDRTINFGFVRACDEELYPLDTCLYRVFRCDQENEEKDILKNYQEDLEYLTSKNYKIKDSVLIVKLFTLNSSGKNACYYEAFYPITK